MSQYLSKKKIPFHNIIREFILDIKENKILSFYEYTLDIGFVALNDKKLNKCLTLLDGLSSGDSIAFHQIDEDRDVWYLKNENIERNETGIPLMYYELFVFKPDEVIAYLSYKEVNLPRYIAVKLDYSIVIKSKENEDKIEESQNENYDLFTAVQLKELINLTGQKYIELTKALLNKISLDKEQDLLPLTLEYRNKFLDKHFKNELQDKKEVSIAELSGNGLSNKRAEAIELVSHPINRDKTKLK